MQTSDTLPGYFSIRVRHGIYEKGIIVTKDELMSSADSLQHVGGLVCGVINDLWHEVEEDIKYE